MNAYALVLKTLCHGQKRIERRLASKRTRRLDAGLMAVAMLAAGSCIGRHDDEPLVRIEQVAALPFQVADHRVPVHLKGWVTLSDPTTNLMFMEDCTGAARVTLPFMNIDPRPGNLSRAHDCRRRSQAFGRHARTARTPDPGRGPHRRPHRFSLYSRGRRFSLPAPGAIG